MYTVVGNIGNFCDIIRFSYNPPLMHADDIDNGSDGGSSDEFDDYEYSFLEDHIVPHTSKGGLGSKVWTFFKPINPSTIVKDGQAIGASHFVCTLCLKQKDKSRLPYRKGSYTSTSNFKQHLVFCHPNEWKDCCGNDITPDEKSLSTEGADEQEYRGGKKIERRTAVCHFSGLTY